MFKPSQSCALVFEFCALPDPERLSGPSIHGIYLSNLKDGWKEAIENNLHMCLSQKKAIDDYAVYTPGTFGKVDAMSEILTEYLQRLEEQQESVMHLIKNQRQLLKEGKAAASLQGLKQTAAKVNSLQLELVLSREP